MWVFFQHPKSARNTPFAFEQVIARTRSLPEVLVFVAVKRAHQPTVSDGTRLRMEHIGNNVYTATLLVGFAEHHVRMIELLEGAMLAVDQGRLVSMERHNITLILGQETVMMGRTSPFYRWLWRWPLLVYEHLKHVFHDTFPGLDFEARNTIVVGVRASL
jgi:K+ transporter